MRETSTPEPTSGASTGPTGTETLTTWKGVSFNVRPASPDDEALLAEFFTRVSEEDRRFRFLSSVRNVSHALLERLVSVDHDRSENFLAFDGDRLIGTAMLAADPDRRRGEVAISLDADYKERGIGWALLDHLSHFARSRGIQRIESIENRANREALAVEADMGFRSEAYPGDPSLVLVSKDLTTS